MADYISWILSRMRDIAEARRRLRGGSASHSSAQPAYEYRPVEPPKRKFRRREVPHVAPALAEPWRGDKAGTGVDTVRAPRPAPRPQVERPKPALPAPRVHVERPKPTPPALPAPKAPPSPRARAKARELPHPEIATRVPDRAHHALQTKNLRVTPTVKLPPVREPRTDVPKPPTPPPRIGIMPRRAKRKIDPGTVVIWRPPTAPTTMANSPVTPEEVHLLGGPEAGKNLQELVFEEPKPGVSRDGRYIPVTGGALGWWENAGVLEVEVPNNYQFSSALDAAAVQDVLLARKGQKAKPARDAKAAGTAEDKASTAPAKSPLAKTSPGKSLPGKSQPARAQQAKTQLVKISPVKPQPAKVPFSRAGAKPPAAAAARKFQRLEPPKRSATPARTLRIHPPRGRK